MPFRRFLLAASWGLFPAVAFATPGRAQASRFDSASVQSINGVTCYHYPRYTVVAREREDEVGSTIVVHARPAGPCSLDSLAGDYVFLKEWAEYFTGLIGDVLVLDSGTGPDLRGLIVIDLPSRRRVFEGSYVELETGGPAGSLGVWQGYELTQTAPGCRTPEGLARG